MVLISVRYVLFNRTQCLEMFQVEYNGDFGNQSDSGSFHASSWEEERARKSQIKWAGDQKDTDRSNDKDTSLRREPTPFPKEMRAMAKRAKKLREQQQQVNFFFHFC